MEPRRLSDRDLRLARLRSQGLTPRAHTPGPRPAAAEVALAAGAAAGIQAQEEPAAALSIRARTRGLTANDVRIARERERTVVRTWLMRGTLHLVPTEDLGLFLPTLGARSLKASRSRLGALDWGARALERGMRLLKKILESGPVSRSLVSERLAAAGLPSEGQAPIALIRYAGLHGLVCYGPTEGGTTTFALLEEWVDYRPVEPGDTTLAELARRHLRAFGPAAPGDLAAWSGLTLTQSRRAWRLIESELFEVRGEAERLWILGGCSPSFEDTARPTIRLLGRFDTYLLGYASRRHAIEERHDRRLNAGGGIIRPSLLVDGRVEGIWRLESRADHGVIKLDPFDRLDSATGESVRAEVRDIARFLGTKPSLILPT